MINIKKIGKEYILPSISFLLLLILFLSINFEFNNLKQIFNYVIIIPLLMQLFYLREEIDLVFIIRGFFYTTLFSCLFAFLYYTFKLDLDVIHVDENNIFRFMGFCGHEGILAIFVTMLSIFYLTLYVKYKINFLEFSISLCLLSIVGLSTKSKTFLVILLFDIVLYFSILFYRNKKKFFQQVLCFTLIILLIALLDLNGLYAYLKRFGNSFLESNILDRITTGRFSIWVSYLEYWGKSTILEILFGVGGTSTIFAGWLPPHNDYIEVLVRYGIIGSVLFVFSIIHYIKFFNRNKKFTVSSVIPLAGIMLVMLIDPFIQARIIFFLLAISTFFVLQDDKQQAVSPIPSKRVLNENLKLSVIVPVYKVEEYLDTCIKSICNQTYKNLEIILVDDGGVDTCPKICDKWASIDERIKVIHKDNGGVSSARNMGLSVCSGDLVSFVDADDYLELDMYEKLIKNIVDNGAHVAICGFNIVKNNTVKPCEEMRMTDFVSTNDLNLIYNRSRIIETSNSYLVKNSIHCFLWRMIFKRSVIEKVTFNEQVKVMEDILFLLPILNKEGIKLSYENNKLYNYRVRPNSAMHMKHAILDNHLAFFNHLQKIVTDQNLLNHFKFMLYADCKLRNEVYGCNDNLTSIESWSTKKNYKASKKFTFGLLLRLRNLLIYHKKFKILKFLYKFKEK